MAREPDREWAVVWALVQAWEMVPVLALSNKRLLVPKKIDKPLRYLKYVILVVTVFYARKTAELWISPYDPWSAYAHLPEGLESVWSESAVGLILLLVTIVGSLLYDRFFSKFVRLVF